MTSHRQQAPKAAHPCFVTLTVLGATPLFSRPELAQQVIDALHALQQNRRLTVYGYVLVDDHFHLIASGDDLPKQVAQLKSTAAQQVLATLATPDLHGLLKRLRRFQDPQKTDAAAQLWQGGDSLEPLLSEEAMRAKLQLIHTYPVKRGYVQEAAHYRYSSAASYAGQPGLLRVNTEW